MDRKLTYLSKRQSRKKPTKPNNNSLNAKPANIKNNLLKYKKQQQKNREFTCKPKGMAEQPNAATDLNIEFRVTE